VQVNLVPLAHVDTLWPLLSEGFQRALLKTGGDLTVGDLWQQARRGDAFLVLAIDDDRLYGASLWRPEVWQTGTKLRCLALYGSDMASWIGEMRAMAQKIAKDCGATSLLAEGRAGWAKIFPNARKLRVLYEETI
jgi:hypothetical protein